MSCTTPAVEFDSGENLPILTIEEAPQRRLPAKHL
jgi:hypothetical protein